MFGGYWTMESQKKNSLADVFRYAYGTSIPVEVLNDPDMKVVWDQTNIIVWA